MLLQITHAQEPQWRLTWANNARSEVSCSYRLVLWVTSPTRFFYPFFFFRCPIESRRSGGREWGENNITVAMISFQNILAFSSWI